MRGENTIQLNDLLIQGVRCRVAQVGDTTSDEAVVFVHGNPGSRFDWYGVLPQVGAFSRAVAPCMPGYGEADHPAEFDYTVEGYARYLDAMLSELAIENVHLVLHDFGGPWGLRWAADNVERVKSVVLTNTGVLEAYHWHKYARIWQTPILGELFQLLTIHPVLRLSLNLDNPKPMPLEFTRRMASHSDWGHKRAVLTLYRNSRSTAALFELVASALRGRNIPCRVIWGAGDLYIPHEYAERQKRYFDAEVISYPDSGHWPMIDEPQRYADDVLEFLRKQCLTAA